MGPMPVCQGCQCEVFSIPRIYEHGASELSMGSYDIHGHRVIRRESLRGSMIFDQFRDGR